MQKDGMRRWTFADSLGTEKKGHRNSEFGLVCWRSVLKTKKVGTTHHQQTNGQFQWVSDTRGEGGGKIRHRRQSRGGKKKSI